MYFPSSVMEMCCGALKESWLSAGGKEADLLYKTCLKMNLSSEIDITVVVQFYP